MTYSPDSFYPAYKNYLKDPEVRNKHDNVFKLYNKITESNYVADLGCATCEYGEYLFKTFPSTKKYIGIDLYPCPDNQYLQTIRADIRDVSLENTYNKIDSFVSIFATEVYFSISDKYAFYNKLFSYDNIKSALISGFVYENHLGKEKIKEEIGFEAFQTIENPMDFVEHSFMEFRMVQKVPPGMFQNQFYEIWKILIRK